MSFLTEAGTFTLNTGTGNQTVTLANGSLTPKAVIVWTTKQTADGITTDAMQFFGAGTGSTARGTIGTTSQDAQATSVADRTQAALLLETRPVNGGAVAEAFDLVSFGAGQFVINVTTAGAAIKVHYLVLGGADLTNANLVTVDSRTTVGAQAITGAGFQPDCVIIFESMLGTLGTGSTEAIAGVGWAISAAKQCAVGWSHRDASANADTRRTQRSGQIIALPQVSADAYFHLADLASLDADGCSLNWTAVSGARKLFCLFLKGGSYDAGVETQKTSTAGTKQTATTNTPTGLLLASFCREATASVVAHSRLSIGGASGAASRGATWIGDVDAAADSEADRATESDQCLLLADAGSPTAFAAAADFSAFAALSFTLDWDDGAGGNPDATAREFVWLAFGEAAAPPAGGFRSRIAGGLVVTAT